MAIYGLARNSKRPGSDSPETQLAAIERKAEELDSPVCETFVDEGGPLGGAAFLRTVFGRKLLERFQAGDALIVAKLEYLAYSNPDLRRTVKELCDRGVSIYVLDALGGQLALDPAYGPTVLRLLVLAGKTDAGLRSERAAATRACKRELGLWITRQSYGKEKIRDQWGTRWKWSQRQLQYIAEIAERLGKGEDVAKVADEFWRRGIKDHRGLPWGKVVPKKGLTPKGSPYEHFRRATWWFHRMKHAGKLPPPWNEIAWTIPEPKGFTVRKRKKRWTPGGTARREKERAELKAQHRADRLARWKREKKARLQSRVHKLLLGKLGTAGIPEAKD